ncbi:hypothetical protein ES288_D05G335300v1 [Gossypium darwinii]|uniref:Uncharacterized protein n=1 Tax=Gossypium darwinii TaxID=34276 RepID=A0A5D2CPQ3_GOSDA|nr:hypothetical protein ES288_D05G335300v1 [Gossypium darwinii]
MDVLQRQIVTDSMKSVNILNKFSKFKILEDAVEMMKPETMGVLLIVFSLLLAMTYQGILKPSGQRITGKSVMSMFTFLLFYISNGGTFLIFWVGNRRLSPTFQKIFYEQFCYRGYISSKMKGS